MKTKIRRLTQLSVIIGLLCHGAQAATNNCNVINVHYVEGNTLQVPCVEVGESLFNATFKILPNHLWELIQATPVSETRSGARSSFQNNALKLPLVQLTDGSLWEALVQLTGQKSATGNLLFQLTGGKKLTATTDLGKVVFRIGNKTDVRRANANANSNANKDKDKDNGNAQNNTNNGNSGNSGNNGNQAPQNITAAVLKVDHIELTGSAKTDLKVSGEIDLLKVISGEPQLLGEVVLPANTHISQVRLILAEGSYVIEDGEKYPLEIPSGEQTGLKIHGDWGITGGQITSVQLDFNADDIRFNKAQGYRIKPTVKVVNVAMQTLPVDSNGNPTDDLLTGKPFVLTVGDKLRFELPDGAYPNPEELSGEIIGEGTISPIYEMKPDGAQFTKNGTITIHYDETKIPEGYSEENIIILRDGEALPSLVNTQMNTVSAQTNHFSVDQTEYVDCDFRDVTEAGNLKWAYEAIQRLCKDAVIQGSLVKSTDGTIKYRNFEPSASPTLFDVLKIYYSTMFNSSRRYNDDNAIANLINDSKAILGVTLSQNDLYSKVNRGEAIKYLAKIHYGYFEEDAIEEMKEMSLTTGVRLDENLSRAELAKLAYDSREFLKRAKDGKLAIDYESRKKEIEETKNCPLITTDPSVNQLPRKLQAGSNCFKFEAEPSYAYSLIVHTNTHHHNLYFNDPLYDNVFKAKVYGIYLDDSIPPSNAKSAIIRKTPKCRKFQEFKKSELKFNSYWQYIVTQGCPSHDQYADIVVNESIEPSYIRLVKMKPKLFTHPFNGMLGYYNEFKHRAVITITNRLTNSGHDGIDIAPYKWIELLGGELSLDLDFNGSIVPVADGKVAKIVDLGNSLGYAVWIYHDIMGQPYTSLYAHLREVKVKVGDQVKKGITTLAYIDLVQKHLHLEIFNKETKEWNGGYTYASDGQVDPLVVLFEK